jgi:chromosome segregation ATPase
MSHASGLLPSGASDEPDGTPADPLSRGQPSASAADAGRCGRTRLLSGLERQDKEVASQSRQLQATIKNLEVEATSITQRIEKLRSDLNTSQNDKQYKAVLAEVKTLETKKKEAEDRAMADMERLEQVKKQAGALSGQLAERKKIFDVVMGQLAERKAECKTRLDELERERTKAGAALPAR